MSQTFKTFYLLLNNCIPLIGVFVCGWDSLYVVQFCFIETVIASLFDYIKLPFLKNDPNGESVDNQTGIVILSFILIPLLFLYSGLMALVFDTKFIPLDKFYLPIFTLVASYTVQLVHFMIFDRTNPDLFRADISKFTCLRDLILMGAIILLPWIGVVFVGLFGGLNIDISHADMFKVIIVLMLMLRTFFEFKMIKTQKEKQLAAEQGI